MHQKVLKVWCNISIRLEDIEEKREGGARNSPAPVSRGLSSKASIANATRNTLVYDVASDTHQLSLRSQIYAHVLSTHSNFPCTKYVQHHHLLFLGFKLLLLTWYLMVQL